MLRREHDLPDVTRIVRKCPIERLHHAMRFLPDVYRPHDVLGLERVESIEDARPSLFPAIEKFLSRRFPGHFEFVIAVAVGLLAVGGEKVGEARTHIAGDMLDEDRDGIRFRIEGDQELLVRHLGDGALGHALISAKLAPDFFEKVRAKCVHCILMIP